MRSRTGAGRRATRGTWPRRPRRPARRQAFRTRRERGRGRRLARSRPCRRRAVSSAGRGTETRAGARPSRRSCRPDPRGRAPRSSTRRESGARRIRPPVRTPGLAQRPAAGAVDDEGRVDRAVGRAGLAAARPRREQQGGAGAPAGRRPARPPAPSGTLRRWPRPHRARPGSAPHSPSRRRSCTRRAEWHRTLGSSLATSPPV